MAATVAVFRQVLQKNSSLLRRNIPRLVSYNIQNKHALSSLRKTTATDSLCPSSSLAQCVVESLRNFSDSVTGESELSQNGTPKSIEERVMKVLKAYDHITADKLTVDSHFINDCGLDSLDHVEVIMAMEDEFGFEIPDGDAEKLLRPRDIIRYIADREDIYE